MILLALTKDPLERDMMSCGQRLEVEVKDAFVFRFQDLSLGSKGRNRRGLLYPVPPCTSRQVGG